jgi:hypothetical protein
MILDHHYKLSLIIDGSVREHETCFGRNNGSAETAEVYINQDKQLAAPTC